jgi:hypothetical protein
MEDSEFTAVKVEVAEEFWGVIPAVLEYSNILVRKGLGEVERRALKEAITDNVRGFKVRAIVVLGIVIGCKYVGKVFVSKER